MIWKGKRVAVLGWGVDTQDVEPWLRSQGAEITVLDESKDGKPFGDLSGYEVLVRSPGVYRYRPEIVKAEKNGTTVTSKTKIFFEEFPGRIIGVTGTKGKGTTSTMIYQILKKSLPAGGQVFLGGNIGTGMFGDRWDEETWAILELSSFQLIDLERSPEIAVVLMVTREHQDWHRDEEEYVRAKANIVKYQKKSDWVVVNKDYPNSVKIGSLGSGQKVWVSGRDFTGKMRLRGEHNRENIAAAVAVARILKIDKSLIDEVIRDFKGLEHRLEEVATINGVTYFDDSFSTTPETTIAAIKAFSEPMILILGGSEKGSDFSEMGRVIGEAANIKAVILIGMMADRIEEAISRSKSKSKIIKSCKSMVEIVEMARKEGESGDVVVLSPACASFDMFKNYKERGNQFKVEVEKLNL